MQYKNYVNRVGFTLVMAVVGQQVYAQDHRWLIRAAVSNIDPTSSPGSIFNETAPVNIDDTYGLTGTISYFFSPHVAADLLVGLPPKHDIYVSGSKTATTKHLPPILSLQYHFTPNAKFNPYIGAGVNYTYFFDEQLDGASTLKLTSSLGLAAQVGIDVHLSPQWSVGADIRYADIDTDVKINGIKQGTVDVDPTVYSINIGYRF